MFIVPAALLAVLVVGCRSRTPMIGASDVTASMAHLPVITLDPIDFAKEVRPARDESAPQTLNTSIPRSEFIVRFQGKRHPDDRHVQQSFKVSVRTRNGLATIATATVKPVGNLYDDVLTYEGVCENPRGKHSDCLVSVSRGKYYLVRRAEIK
jgi:hypothetical protein